MTDPAVLLVAGLVGLALGSFLNVCVARWPRGASVVRPRSACPACAAPVRWYDQIPVASWVALGARCRACGAGISPCYPLVEGAAAAICVVMVLTRGASLEAAGGAFLLLALLGIAITDARFYLIPDQFSLGGAAAGLALAFAPGGVTPGGAAAGVVVGFGGMWLVGAVGTRVLVRARPGRLETAAREHDQGRRRARDAPGVRALARPRAHLVVFLPAVPLAALAGREFGPAAAAAVVGAWAAAQAVLVAWVEGLGAGAPPGGRIPPGGGVSDPPDAALGGGDVKMMALVGAFTGPWGAVLTVFLGAFAGLLGYLKLRLLLGTRQLVPFGVFLAVGAAITLWRGDAIISWYLRLAGLPPP